VSQNWQCPPKRPGTVKAGFKSTLVTDCNLSAEKEKKCELTYLIYGILNDTVNPTEPV
jgi:hypothetical protein